MTTAARLELLLEHDAPTWHRWDGDIGRLVEALWTHLEASDLPPTSGRAVWLLDRLAGPDPSPFETLADRTLGRDDDDWTAARAHYAWGRRLRGPERRLLLERLTPGWPVAVVQANQAAWRDSAGEDEVDSLLDWPAACATAGCEAGQDLLVARVALLTGGRAALMAHLERALEALEPEWPAGDRDLGWALQHVARTVPQRRRRAAWRLTAQASVEALLLGVEDDVVGPAEEVPDDVPGAVAWLADVLARSGHAALAELLTRRVHPAHIGDLPERALRLWLAMLARDDLNAFEESCWRSQHALPVAARVIPAEDPARWPLGWDSDQMDVQMVAWSGWLRPEHRDLLRDWFGCSDRAVAACAFKAYLDKTPAPVLAFLDAERSDALPLWQARELDRRVHAPAAVRPGPSLPDERSALMDPARHDPFNDRGY